MAQLKKLGPRKEAIVALVPSCERAAEIGADHGLISAGILAAGRCREMLVCDISAASLQKARRLFVSLGWEARVRFAVADGLDAVEEGVGAIVVAGMGQQTMTEILDRGQERIGGAPLVLQANTRVAALRAWLCAHGFLIEAESLVLEEGRYYVVLRAGRGDEPLNEGQMLLGPRLLEQWPPLFEAYLRHQLACARVGQSQVEQRRAALIASVLEERMRR